jgi:hypothetical protein
VEEYQIICNNQWLQAKHVIDKEMGNKLPDYCKIKFLYKLIKVVLFGQKIFTISAI